MKVGLVCPYNITKGGGVQSGVLAIQQELIKRGHNAIVITPQPNGLKGQKWPNVLFVGSARDIRSPLATTAQISYRVSSDVVKEVLDREQFDVLHFHEPWVPMMSRQFLNHSTSINIGTFHARLPDTLMSKTVEAIITPYTRPVIDKLDALTAVSTAASEYVTSLTDRPIKIIPNGIDLDSYQVKRKTSKQKTILYIGRLEKRKGLKYLINAFANLQHGMPDVRLVLAGDGPDREKLEEKVTNFGLKNVEFLGFVEDDEKLRLLGEADVFCSPALYGESFGIVLLEAMAAGVPTVAGHNPGYQSVMQGRGRLSLVNPKSTRDFARRLALFLEDDDFRKLWLDWAKEYIKQFEYTKVVDAYEELYQSLLKAKA